MDPLSALSLASSVIQFVDFTSKLISDSFEVCSSISGTTSETADLSTIITDLGIVTRRLSVHSGKPGSDDEIALSDLVSKCRRLSDDLLKVLNKLKSKNPQSKWESVRVIWASMQKREQVASMEKRVNSYRNEILLRINAMMSEEQSSVRVQLEKIEQQNDSCATRTRDELRTLRIDILQAVEQLQENCCQSNNLPSLGRPIESLKDIHTILSNITEASTKISKEDWILTKLRFDSMYSREDSIEEAHTKTFNWLLHEPTDDSEQYQVLKALCDSESQSRCIPNSQSKMEEPELRRHARASLLDWLRSGSGVFYISGKAGSGKSTLMKFLSQNPRTRKELNLWATDKKLVFVHFFFWDSGSELQRSLEGLYRSILFEVLRECPELIQDIFPGLWKAVNDSRGPGSGDMPLRFPMILEAFDVLTINKKPFTSHKFCFFIDGLDEYAGDHWKIARSLKTWAASPDIKICVSSRPHNEFEDSFSPDPNLRLRFHELTKEDIEQFVRGELGSDERFVRVRDNDDQYLKLVNKIVELADGVFLWVRLATSSLLTGLSNQYSISELEEKLKTIPAGINNLFRKMWDSIELSDRARSARTFLVATCRRFLSKPNMLTYSFLDDLSEEAQFTDELFDGTTRALTENEILERLDRMRRRLNGRCKGLIEITETGSDDLFFKYSVDFLHRTVKEFLIQNEIQEELKVRAGNFDAFGSILLTHLAQIKFVPTREQYFCGHGQGNKLNIFQLVYDLLAGASFWGELTLACRSG